MRWVLAFMVLGLTPWLYAQASAGPQAPTRFRVVDIYLDSNHTPLAAYQLEFSITNGFAKIVGIEGGDHAAFRDPPFYDPKAIQHERVIIAAFNTAPQDGLPSGKTRVAAIHLQIVGSRQPEFTLKLQTAGDAAGHKIAAEASFEERRPR